MLVVCLVLLSIGVITLTGSLGWGLIAFGSVGMIIHVATGGDWQ